MTFLSGFSVLLLSYDCFLVQINMDGWIEQDKDNALHEPQAEAYSRFHELPPLFSVLGKSPVAMMS